MKKNSREQKMMDDVTEISEKKSDYRKHDEKKNRKYSLVDSIEER